MALSQPARFGETWSDDRIRSYLERLPPAGESADFHVLYTAYKHMRDDDFARFLDMFKAAGRDLQARNRDGRTLAELLQGHAQAAPFLTLLQHAG